ncbi:MAG: hypothetical protein LPJ92_05675, partial [Rhodobacterales bacterium]|nr:hypothetical protein [Rhodobacterales bacterium]MDX5389805.1 hypothetical protein [Rhodobacterales bacterium]MDX5489502.1 hypothetical protein [Rhodobacterales bacterium]
MSDTPPAATRADRKRRIFAWLTDSDAADLREGEAGNGLIHVLALTLTKVADSLIDPKLVLSW